MVRHRLVPDSLFIYIYIYCVQTSLCRNPTVKRTGSCRFLLEPIECLAITVDAISNGILHYSAPKRSNSVNELLFPCSIFLVSENGILSFFVHLTWNQVQWHQHPSRMPRPVVSQVKCCVGFQKRFCPDLPCVAFLVQLQKKSLLLYRFTISLLTPSICF